MTFLWQGHNCGHGARLSAYPLFCGVTLIKPKTGGGLPKSGMIRCFSPSFRSCPPKGQVPTRAGQKKFTETLSFLAEAFLFTVAGAGLSGKGRSERRNCYNRDRTDQVSNRCRCLTVGLGCRYGWLCDAARKCKGFLIIFCEIAHKAAFPTNIACILPAKPV